jgi:hypothetical protein
MLLFLVKFTHSLIVIYMLACLSIIWQYGLAGLCQRSLGLAAGSILLEAAVYGLWGFRCPLTEWAIALGDDTGADFIGELFLLGNLNFVSSFAIFFAGGTMLAIWRYLRENATSLSTNQNVAE